MEPERVPMHGARFSYQPMKFGMPRRLSERGIPRLLSARMVLAFSTTLRSLKVSQA